MDFVFILTPVNKRQYTIEKELCDICNNGSPIYNKIK